jgi:hypothetical protein
MCVTAHWLVTDETGKIERKLAGVACKIFEGKMFVIFKFFCAFSLLMNSLVELRSHTYDKIAKMIDGILDEFTFHTKVHQIVTNNGSNFVKAFKEFSVSMFYYSFFDHLLTVFISISY